MQLKYFEASEGCDDFNEIITV